MKEYIEREAAKNEVLSWAVCINRPDLLSKEDTLHCIDSLPAADVAQVRHGKWERRNMGLWGEDYAYVCSACGEVWTLIDSTPEDNNMNYCPNCGALMDGKEEDHA